MGVDVLQVVAGGHPQGEGAHVGHYQVLKLGVPLLDAGAQAHPQGHGVLRMLRQGGALGKQLLQIVHKHTQLRQASHQHHVVDGGNGNAAVPDAPDDDLLDLLENGLAEAGQELPVQRSAQGLPAQLAGQDAAPASRMAEAGLSPLRQGQQLPLLLGVQL